MKINLLGIRTDLIFRNFLGKVENKNDYIVVKTPSNQAFFWGNYIIFKEAPKKGDYKTWCDIFNKEFSDLTDIKHMTFIWNENKNPGESQEFTSNGFELEDSIILKANSTSLPGNKNNDIKIRQIETSEEWKQVIDLQIITSGEDYNSDEYLPFIKKQFADRKKMIDAGKGKWFGAFLGDILVGDLGIFVESEIARFQAVETHPDHRKKGICKTLVHYVSNYALTKLKVKTLVLEADEDYIAADIYKSLGYCEVEKLYGLCHYDRESWDKN